MKTILQACLAVLCITLAAISIPVGFALRDALESIGWAAAAVPIQVEAIRAGVFLRTDDALREIRETRAVAAKEVQDTRKALLASVESIRSTADRQLTGISGKLDAQLTRTNDSIAEAAKIRSDIRPVLAEAQETLSQASSTIAVIRPQALGLIAATKVTMGSTAQTMRVVAKEAPDTGKAVRELAQSGAGIASDARKVADDFTRPKTFWEKVKTWVWAGAGLAGRIK